MDRLICRNGLLHICTNLLSSRCLHTWGNDFFFIGKEELSAEASFLGSFSGGQIADSVTQKTGKCVDSVQQWKKIAFLLGVVFLAIFHM